jgi:hypothetical protein
MRMRPHPRAALCVLACLGVILVALLPGVRGGEIGSPDEVAALFERMRQAAKPRAPEDVPLARPEDLRLSVISEPTGQLTAVIMNITNEPVRIYVPDFFGPEIAEPRTTQMPIRMSVRPQFGAGDYVILRHHEIFGRYLHGDPQGSAVSCFYYFNLPRRDGEAGVLVGVLSSTGKYYEFTPAPTPKGGSVPLGPSTRPE